MKQLSLVVLFALAAAACAPSSPAPGVEPSGAPVEVSGIGTVSTGDQPHNLVIVPESADETYCLTGASHGLVAGDRVRFEGSRYTALALAGETCLRFDPTRLEKQE